jgi:hypothetical protein
MTCSRCAAEHDGKKRWCADCETAYDGWVRQYASDMIAPALGGMLVVLMCAMVLPSWARARSSRSAARSPASARWPAWRGSTCGGAAGSS